MSTLLHDHRDAFADPDRGLEKIQIPTPHGPTEVAAVAWAEPDPFAVYKVRRSAAYRGPEPSELDSLYLDSVPMPDAPEPLA